MRNGGIWYFLLLVLVLAGVSICFHRDRSISGLPARQRSKSVIWQSAGRSLYSSRNKAKWNRRDLVLSTFVKGIEYLRVENDGKASGVALAWKKINFNWPGHRYPLPDFGVACTTVWTTTTSFASVVNLHRASTDSNSAASEMMEPVENRIKSDSDSCMTRAWWCCIVGEIKWQGVDCCGVDCSFCGIVKWVKKWAWCDKK